MTSKPFDCVEMKHRGADLVLAETRDMSIEQEVEYWRVATEALKVEQHRARERRATQQRSTDQPPT